MQAGSLYNVYSIIAHCCVCVCVGGGVVCVRVGRWADVISKCAAIFDHPLTFLFFASFCVSGLVCQHAVFAHTMGDGHAQILTWLLVLVRKQLLISA